MIKMTHDSHKKTYIRDETVKAHLLKGIVCRADHRILMAEMKSKIDIKKPHLFWWD